LGRWALESQDRLGLLATLDGPPILSLVEQPDADSSETLPNQGGD